MNKEKGFTPLEKATDKVGDIPCETNSGLMPPLRKTVRGRSSIKGFTLIELLVVITIVGILAIALAFEFRGWIGGYNIESQVKEMYVDLMNARANAMQRNRSHFVIVAVDNYQIFEDTNESGAYDAGTDNAMVKFTNPKNFNSNYQSQWTGTITMDTRGLVSPNTTIQFNIGTNNPDYDCIILFATRINVGLMSGGSCVAR